MVTNFTIEEAESRDCKACGLADAQKLLTIWTASDRKHINCKWECRGCYAREWEKFVTPKESERRCPRCGDVAPTLIAFQHANMFMEKFCIRCMNEVHSGDDPWKTAKGEQRVVRYPSSQRASLGTLSSLSDPPVPQATSAIVEPPGPPGGTSLCALCYQHSTKLYFRQSIWVCLSCRDICEELPADIDLESWLRSPSE